jgi:CBS domain containing-hemolysin-like protein
VSYVGWVVLLICFLAGGTLFFSVNTVALRIFSRVKLQEAFKAANKKADPEDLTERLVANAEKLILSCSLYRLIFNMCILLLLLAVFATLRQGNPAISGYVLTFVIAMTIFSVFSLAIPHAWAKYAGEKILSRTYGLLMLSAIIASPVLHIFKLYDGFVRRLAGVAETTPKEQQEERQEEFLNGLEQRRTEGVLDEEEQQMTAPLMKL